MKKNRVYWQFKTVFLFALLTISSVVMAQKKSAAFSRKIEKGFELLELERASEALKLFKDLDAQGPKDVLVSYGLGTSYLAQDHPDEQLKAIAPLEYAVANRNDQVPLSVYLKLGQIYHKAYRFGEAIDQFQTFITKSAKTEPQIILAKRLIEMCQSGIELTKKPLDVVVQNLGAPINTKYTEYCPLVNAEENVLVYTALKPLNMIDPSSAETREAESVFIASSENGLEWSSPTRLKIDKLGNVSSCGLSPDGQKLLLYLSDDAQGGSLYLSQLSGDKVTSMLPLDAKINSRHTESTASLSIDEQTIYFSSNRPGGFGGMDLYKCEKGKDGRWANPTNLGALVNTKYDEEAPFIHPDRHTLYFHSNGHNSIGNNDIFKTQMIGGAFNKPVNLGYPINTPYNDNFFVLSPDGKKGYYSSDRNGGMGGQDIYFLGIPEEQNVVPLTLIKGKVLAGEKQVPVPTKIKVIDKQTGQPMRGVYNPNPKTGNYLIIFPPGKNYDMIVEAQGYLPHTVNINVPNQTYFYEMYQKIILKPVRQFDVVVGQQVTIENAFEDVNKGKKPAKIVATPRMANEAMLVRDSLDVYDLMDNIIAASDTTAYDYLLDLMFKVNPIEDVNFKDSSVVSVQSAFYFEEKDKMVPQIIGKDTIYTAPVVYTDPKDLSKNNTSSVATLTPAKNILGKKVKIYFQSGKDILEPNYKSDLDGLIKILETYPSLGLEISGYADSKGNKDANLKLSNRRATNTLLYFNQKGVARRRVVAKGFGQVIKEGRLKNDADTQKDRKVEVKIINVK